MANHRLAIDGAGNLIPGQVGNRTPVVARSYPPRRPADMGPLFATNNGISPTLKVEVAFTSDPLATSQTWVDVSQWVRRTPGVSIRRGRQRELDNFDAGSCQITLSNRDRRFDPSYSAGPYFGNLLPRKQIRVTAYWGIAGYTMFQGWVTGWPQSLAAPGGKDATVTVEAMDAIGWLANNRVPADLVYSYANTTIGSLVFFLRGADTSTWNDATNAGYGASVLTGTGATSTTMAAGSSSPSLTFDRSTAWKLGTRLTSSAGWSISFWMRTTETATTTYMFGGGFVGVGLGASMSFAGSTGVLTFTFGTVAASTTVRVNDGIAHHIVVTGNDSIANNTFIYVDGVQHSTTTAGGAGNPIILEVIGVQNMNLLAAEFYGGSLQDFAVFSKQMSAAEVLSACLPPGPWHVSQARVSQPRFLSVSTAKCGFLRKAL